MFSIKDVNNSFPKATLQDGNKNKWNRTGQLDTILFWQVHLVSNCQEMRVHRAPSQSVLAASVLKAKSRRPPMLSSVPG